MVQDLKGVFSVHPRIVVSPTTKNWVQTTNEVLRTACNIHYTLNFSNKALYSFLSWFSQRDISSLFIRTGVSSKVESQEIKSFCCACPRCLVQIQLQSPISEEIDNSSLHWTQLNSSSPCSNDKIIPITYYVHFWRESAAFTFYSSTPCKMLHDALYGMFLAV